MLELHLRGPAAEPAAAPTAEPALSLQLSLQLGSEEPETRTRLMQALDSINQRHGRGTLHLASAGTAGKHRVWEMKQERKTPPYATDWALLPVAS